MTGPNACDPCGCIPGNISNDYFKQTVLELLCTLTGSGGLVENVNVAKFGGTAVSLGQKAMAASMPVVIASDQTSFPVTIAAGAAVIGHVIVDADTPGVAATNLGKAEDAVHASGDTGVFSLAVRNDQESTFTSTDGDYSPIGVNLRGATFTAADGFLTTGTIAMASTSNAVTLSAKGMGSILVDTSGTWTGTLIAEGTVDGATFFTISGMGVTSGSSNGNTYTANTQKVYNIAGCTSFRIRCSIVGTGTATINARASQADNSIFIQNIGSIVPGTAAAQLAKAEDAASASGDTGIFCLNVQEATPTNDVSTDGDYQAFKGNVEGYLYVDGVRRNAFTPTQPTVTNATSFTLVVANTQRKYCLVQNNSSANIMINPNNGTLTGIVPTSTNLGIVLYPGGVWETPPNGSPVTAITCYQTSGGSINTVSVIEES